MRLHVTEIDGVRYEYEDGILYRIQPDGRTMTRRVRPSFVDVIAREWHAEWPNAAALTSHEREG